MEQAMDDNGSASEQKVAPEPKRRKTDLQTARAKGIIPKAPSAFARFTSHMFASGAMNQEPKATRFKKVAEAWRCLNEEEKARWHALAEEGFKNRTTSCAHQAVGIKGKKAEADVLPESLPQTEAQHHPPGEVSNGDTKSNYPPSAPEGITQTGAQAEAEVTRQSPKHRTQISQDDSQAIQLPPGMQKAGRFFLDLSAPQAGRGSYGLVQRATCSVTGFKVALKFVRKLGSWKREVEAYAALSDLQHKATCKQTYREAVFARACFRSLFLVFHDSGTALDGLHWMALEYVELTLHDAIKKQHTDLPVRAIITQAVTGLLFLRHAGFLHMDLKPSNLGWAPGQQQVKLFDFGISLRIDALPARPHDDSTPPFVSFPFRSPELHFWGKWKLSNPNGWEPMLHSADVWSLGVLFFQLLSGEHLYHSEKELDMIFSWLYTCSSRPVALRPPFLTRRLTRALQATHAPEDSRKLLATFLTRIDIRASLRHCRNDGGWDWLDAIRKKPLPLEFALL